jgi:tRNA modification GTPase
MSAPFVHLPRPYEHARARFTRIRDPLAPADPARSLDDALLTAFLAPHSYTGDDLVEIATHGSPVVLEAVLHAALALATTHALALRLAEPGEFTQRAFLSGRIDLTQAEAVHDLIAARTLDQARVSAQQLGGAISRRVAPAKEQLLHLIALLEAGMDFASGELDDVDVVPPHHIAAAIAATEAPLATLAASYRHGQLLRAGASLALVGRPNAGKSSLFNRLLERERAIVTAVPGTTRDTVEETLALGGIPLRLVDTAGLRDFAAAGDNPADEAERQGIARSREALADADLVLFVQDATHPLTAAELALAGQLSPRPHLLIRNKIDLVSSTDSSSGGERSIATSALTGQGLDTLRAAILRELHAEGALADFGALNNLRQQQAVVSALEALAAAAAANLSALPHEMILLDLHTALRALDSLTGITTADDILGRIFATFCIGK